MLEVSYAIRSKPRWWEKVKDPEIRAKWKKEALEQDVWAGRLQEGEIDYLLDELEMYEKMRDEVTGVQVRSWTRNRGVMTDEVLGYISHLVQHGFTSRTPSSHSNYKTDSKSRSPSWKMYRNPRRIGILGLIGRSWTSCTLPCIAPSTAGHSPTHSDPTPKRVKTATSNHSSHQNRYIGPLGASHNVSAGSPPTSRSPRPRHPRHSVLSTMSSRQMSSLPHV